jgi:hypothetical protein
VNEFETLVLSKLDKLGDRIEQVDGRLTKHMDDEENEIESMQQEQADIRALLNDWRFAAEKRHAELIRSLDAWTTKVDCSQAFLHVDGKPDLVGHKDDHLTRKQFADEIDDLKRNTRKVVVGTGATGVMTWLMYVVWEAFLRGPR